MRNTSKLPVQSVIPEFTIKIPTLALLLYVSYLGYDDLTCEGKIRVLCVSLWLYITNSKIAGGHW